MTLRRGLVLAAAAAVIGCSWLVDPLEDNPRCAPDGANAICPAGKECKNGRCEQACRTDVPDTCWDNLDNDCDGNTDEVDPMGRDTCGDQIDNDCDGHIDEGSDGDHDGFSWCGQTLGGKVMSDCDDSLAAVNPGAPEICDGRDSDCDGVTDETGGGQLCALDYECIKQRCVRPSCAIEGSSLACSSDQRCNAETGQCERIPSQCAEIQCAADEECDPATQACRKKAPLANGAPCSRDDECLSKSCIDAAALRLSNRTRVCGEACCSDDQCGAGEQCFVSGTGARSCLPSALVAMASARPCTNEDACTDAELCALGRGPALAAPTFVPRHEVVSSVCRARPFLTGRVGDYCSADAECSAGVCVRGPLLALVCSNPCGSSHDCLALGDAVGAAYCRYIDVPLGEVADSAAVCVVPRLSEPVGAGRYGDPCMSPSECLDRGCVGATSTRPGRCTPTCCSDSHCGPREDGQTVTCRPFAFGARYEMRCNLQ